MHKGIYQDKRTKTWYIHTTIQGKSVTIRGYPTKKHADDDYDLAIAKWKRDHNCLSIVNQYEKVRDDFIDYRSKKVSHETLKKDKMYFCYWDKFFANQTLNNIFNIDRLRIIFDNLNSESENKRYRLIICFNEFATFCYMNNYITNDVLTAINVLFQPPKMNRHTETNKRYISQEEINTVLSHVQEKDDNLFALALSVLYSGGLRISELLGLLGSDIDLEHKKIKVCRQLMSNGRLTDQLKTSNSYREVPISSKLLNQFNTYLSDNNKTSVISSKGLEQKRVFPYSHTEFRRRLKKYTDYTAHEFRHSFCTNLAKKCSNISDVSYCAKVSGHTTSMFLNTYVKSLESELVNKFF